MTALSSKRNIDKRVRLNIDISLICTLLASIFQKL